MKCINHNGGLTNADRDEIQGSGSLMQTQSVHKRAVSTGRGNQIDRQKLTGLNTKNGQSHEENTLGRTPESSHEGQDNLALNKGKTHRLYTL